VYLSAAICLSHVALCAKSSTVSSDSPRTSKRTRSIVSVIRLTADLSENRAVTRVCVCVCVGGGGREGAHFGAACSSPDGAVQLHNVTIQKTQCQYRPVCLPLDTDRFASPWSKFSCLLPRMTPAVPTEPLIIFSADLERYYYWGSWARGGAVGVGTALQAGRSLGFFIDLILPAAMWPGID
jgi:hypothetical protein